MPSRQCPTRHPFHYPSANTVRVSRQCLPRQPSPLPIRPRHVPCRSQFMSHMLGVQRAGWDAAVNAYPPKLASFSHKGAKRRPPSIARAPNAVLTAATYGGHPSTYIRDVGARWAESGSPPDVLHVQDPHLHAQPCQSIQCQPAAFQLPRSHSNSSISITVSNLFILSSYSIKKPITQPASGKVHFILMPFSTNPNPNPSKIEGGHANS
jgi:hypothetical protein